MSSASDTSMLRRCILNGEIIGSDLFVTEYELQPGRAPSERKDAVLLWASSAPMWAAEPLCRFPLEGVESTGECVLGGIALQNTQYIAALASGGRPTALQGTLAFLPGAAVGQPLSIDMSVRQSGPDVLNVSVNGLPGNNPEQYGNWFGLWEGECVSDDGSGCLFRAAAKSRQADFTAQLGPLPLKFDSLYTLVYAVGPEWFDVATALTFRTTSY